MDEFQEVDELYRDHFPTPAAVRPPVAIQDEPYTAPMPDHEVDDDQEVNIIAPDIIPTDGNDDEDGSDDEAVQTETLHKIATGCGCMKNCIKSINKTIIQSHVDNIREMTKDERDLYVMGALHKLNPDDKRTRCGERKRAKYDYTYEGRHICKQAFLIIYDVGKSTLQAIIKHLAIHGNVPRVHGNSGRIPHHAVTYEDVRRVVSFILSYGSEHGLPQPAAPRGRDNTAPVFLPAQTTKTYIHSLYTLSSQESNSRALKCKAFRGIWAQCIPHIKIATPEDDVCAKCEMARNSVADARTDDEKLEASIHLQQHIIAAKLEHKVYRTCVRSSKEEFQDTPPELQVPAEPCTTDLQHCHYTFDFAQNVALPHHARQMGPMYFVTARKVHIFGVRDDGISRQFNYLVDEAETIEKDGKGIHGSNAVISMLDHFLTTYAHGEKRTSLHADNCGGQNKNRYVMAYFAWRTMVGLNHDVRYMMQIPGHARCLVDAGFGHIKKLYRRSDCETLSDIENVVNHSSTNNVAVMYGADNVQWRDWKAFLTPHFKALKGVRSFQQFRFSTDHPGCTFVKESDDSDEIMLKLSTTDVMPTGRPAVIPAAGLSAERAKYLHQHVRPYLREASKDITCPQPEE